MLRLAEHEHVVGAWAERYPEHGTELVWACIRDGRDGSHRVEALQAEDQSVQIRHLFPVCEAASRELIGWVNAMPRRKGSRG